jgi:hypothetical protein
MPFGVQTPPLIMRHEAALTALDTGTGSQLPHPQETNTVDLAASLLHHMQTDILATAFVDPASTLSARIPNK